jgi:tetratricopeptide (TPR) repeat protein
MAVPLCVNARRAGREAVTLHEDGQTFKGVSGRGLSDKGCATGTALPCDFLIELSPSSAAVHNRLAVILAIKLKRYPEALTALRCALALEPDNIVYTSNFATLSKMAAEAAEH